MMILTVTTARVVRSLLASSCVLACAAPSLAQDRADDAGGGLQDIVVTAQKRDQSAQDVAIAMSVITSDVLRRQNVQNVAEIVQTLPNVQVNYGLGQNAFNIRGIGANEFASNFDSPVAVHVDEVYLSKNFMSNLLLFDVDRVEALKGPQGTLFGRNTTGGSINFYTRKPTDTLTAGGTLSYDDYETIRAEAYLSGPLSETLSARLSGMYIDQNQGFYKNLTTGRDEGYEKKFAVRAQLQWKGASSSFLLTGNYGHDHSNSPPYDVPGVYTPQSLAAGTPQFCPQYLAGTVTGADANCVRATDGDYPRDGDPYTSTGNTTHRTRGTSKGVIGRFETDLDWANLTAISSYQNYGRELQEDSDSSPRVTLEGFEKGGFKQFSQEVRLSSKNDGIWHYVLGAYYQHDKFTDESYLLVGGPSGLYTATNQRLNAAALFFHNEVDVTPTVSLTAGARYSHEKLKIDSTTYFGSGVAPGRVYRPDAILATLASSALTSNGGKRTDENVSFKLGIQWKPELSSDFVDKLILYSHVSTGFRSGGFNAIFASTQESLTSLAPETLTAYEAGFKSTLANRTLTINGALFRYDFKDGFINVDSPVSPIPITINAAGIKTYGAELELQWMPVRRLTFSGGLGWLDAKIDSNITAGGQSLKGDRPVNAPRWTFNGSVNYSVDLTDSLKVQMTANGSYRTSQYLEAVNAPSNREPGYWIVGAQLGLADADDRWALSAWVKNLTKTKYRTYVNDLPGLGILLNVYAPPRVFGSTLSFKI
jgi:iron complex outermembrane receptor protein